MRLNNLDLVDLNNRPSVDSRVAIRAIFMNDGEYVDVDEIRDVMVFKRTSTVTPSSILDADNLVSEDYSGSITTFFGVSAEESGPALNTSSYFYSASGVYRIGQGDYVCVLDGITLTSSICSVWGTDFSVVNSASATGEYFAVWTVKFPSQSDYQTIFIPFTLYNDTFVAISEPLLIRTSNRLMTKKIPLGSKRDLKVTTDFTIENRAIDDSIKNLFKTNIAVNPAFEIIKINDDINLPARVEVSGFSDTSSLVTVTSDNTFVLSFNTDDLRTHAKLLAGELGNMAGVYYLRVKFTLLNEIVVTPPLYFQIT